MKNNRIKGLRLQTKESLKTVAESVGIAESQLSFYENNKRQPRDNETWVKLADYFDVSVPYIMGIDEVKGDMVSISVSEYERLKDAEKQLNNIKQILK